MSLDTTASTGENEGKVDSQELPELSDDLKWIISRFNRNILRDQKVKGRFSDYHIGPFDWADLDVIAIGDSHYHHRRSDYEARLREMERYI